jgi:putative transposase
LHSNIWHLDEMVINISGKKHYLWRAVDQDGYVLDEITQTWHNTKAAKQLLMRLSTQQGMPPKRIITDKLRSYGAAKRQIMPAIEHRSHKGLKNRAENSHLPLRKRERSILAHRGRRGGRPPHQNSKNRPPIFLLRRKQEARRSIAWNFI